MGGMKGAMQIGMVEGHVKRDMKYDLEWVVIRCGRRGERGCYNECGRGCGKK